MATITARTTITNALRRLAILTEEEAPSAAQATDALAILNDMMQGFPALGIQYQHAPLTLDDALNVPDEQTRNVMLLLAWEIADGYGRPISDKLAVDISAAKSALQAAYYVVPLAQQDPGIRARVVPGYGGNARYF